MGNLLLLNSFAYHGLDNAVWSLAHELKISLIMPLLAWFVRQRWGFSLAFSFLFSLAAAALPQPAWLTLTLDYRDTIQYIYLFAIGAAIACHADDIQSWADTRNGAWQTWLLLALGSILFFSTSAMMPGDLVGCGAGLIVLFCVSSPAAARALCHPALLWLGRVSFSLYLVHLPVLLTLMYTLHNVAPVWLILIGVLPLSLLVAEAMTKVIERPSMKAARMLANRIDASRQKDRRLATNSPLGSGSVAQ